MIKQILTAAIILMYTYSINAQHHDDHHEDNHKTEHHNDHDHHHKFHAAVYNGVATNFDHNTSGYALGLDVFYNTTSWLAIGVAGEYVFAEDGELAFSVPFAFKPLNNFRLILAPLAIQAAGHHADEGDGTGHKSLMATTATESVEKEWHYGARFGVAYDFHISKLSLSPGILYDVTNTQALIVGLSVGFGF